MITPINNHVLIEPLKHESFVASQRDSFEEIGIVVAIPDIFESIAPEECPKKGDKIFFDSWLAGHYPTGNGDEYFWLVKMEDIRAIEKQ